MAILNKFKNIIGKEEKKDDYSNEDLYKRIYDEKKKFYSKWFLLSCRWARDCDPVGTQKGQEWLEQLIVECPDLIHAKDDDNVAFVDILIITKNIFPALDIVLKVCPEQLFIKSENEDEPICFRLLDTKSIQIIKILIKTSKTLGLDPKDMHKVKWSVKSDRILKKALHDNKKVAKETFKEYEEMRLQ